MNLGENIEVQSLNFYKDFLIVGTNEGSVSGYIWNEKQQKIEVKKSWEVKIPILSNAFAVPDINSMWLDEPDGRLYAGCGDNNVYSIDLEGGVIVRNFLGHKDYIHSVDGGAPAKIVSASEDGAAKLWDTRQKNATDTIEPAKNEKLVRPQFGKWLGTVALNEDWLICGGGPNVSLWHLRSLEATTIFSFPGKAHVSDFYDDTILVGGEYQKFYHYNFNGEIKSEIPVSSTCVYSILWQTSPHKLLSIAGASNNIDICSNFTYRDIVVNLYKK